MNNFPLSISTVETYNHPVETYNHPRLYKELGACRRSSLFSYLPLVETNYTQEIRISSHSSGINTCITDLKDS